MLPRHHHWERDCSKKYKTIVRLGSFEPMPRRYSDFAISYGSPNAIDGKPVTSDAVLTNIPRPRFWSDEQRASRMGCNAIVRVDLDASGTVTNVASVGNEADSCRNINDIFEAARNITFQPALRDGVPVSEQVAIFYTLR
jgi:hypothetical protein